MQQAAAAGELFYEHKLLQPYLFFDVRIGKDERRGGGSISNLVSTFITLWPFDMMHSSMFEPQAEMFVASLSHGHCSSSMMSQEQARACHGQSTSCRSGPAQSLRPLLCRPPPGKGLHAEMQTDVFVSVAWKPEGKKGYAVRHLSLCFFLPFKPWPQKHPSASQHGNAVSEVDNKAMAFPCCSRCFCP